MFILLFAFIYVSFSSITASINLADNTHANQLLNINVHDVSTMKTALEKLKNPFTKEDKLKRTAALLTGESLFDGGMFQACIHEDYDHGNRDLKILNYMVYKTSKYGLALLKSILANPNLANYTLFKPSKKNNFLFDIQKFTRYKLFKEQMQTKEFVLCGFAMLYKGLQHRSIDDNIHSFTPQDVFSYAFLFAFLHDIAYAKQLKYCSLNYDFIANMYQSFTKQKEAQAQTLAFSLLNLYTEQDAGPVNFEALKKWHGNKEHYIVPILNCKDGFIGINTLNLCITKQYCTIGFGIYESLAHHKSWQALTDLDFHDFVHGELRLKNRGNDVNPSLGELFFFKTASITMPVLITEYCQAKKLNNVFLQQEVTKYKLALFFCLHEFFPNPGSFESITNRDTVRYNITDAVKSFIELESIYSKNTDSLIDSKTLHKILFYALDMLILFQKAYPALSKTLMRHDLKIEEGTLISTRANQTVFHKILSTLKSLIGIRNDKSQIQYNQLLPVLKHLAYCMSDAWTCFFEKYSIMFNGTMPFMKEDRKTLALLEATIDI